MHSHGVQAYEPNGRRRHRLAKPADHCPFTNVRSKKRNTLGPRKRAGRFGKTTRRDQNSLMRCQVRDSGLKFQNIINCNTSLIGLTLYNDLYPSADDISLKQNIDFMLVTRGTLESDVLLERCRSE